MSDIYGKDLKLVNGDIVFTPDGDVEIIEGPACIAQDIDQSIKLTLGSITWDVEAGSNIPLFLNDSGIDDDAIAAELERVAITDARIDPESVEVDHLKRGKFRLSFMPLGAIDPEVLLFDLVDLLENQNE